MKRYFLIFVLSIFLIGGFAAIKEDADNGKEILCNGSLLIELPEGEYTVEGDNQKWNVEKEVNFVFISNEKNSNEIGDLKLKINSLEKGVLILKIKSTIEKVESKVKIQDSQFEKEKPADPLLAQKQEKINEVISQSPLINEYFPGEKKEPEKSKDDNKIQEKPEKSEPVEDKKDDKESNLKIDSAISLMGGTYNLSNDKSNFSMNGEFIIAGKSNKGLFGQFAAMTDINNVFKRFGQSIGFGIESKLGFFLFVDAVEIRYSDYKKTTFHFQVRPAIRLTTNRISLSGFYAYCLSSDQATGIDDPANTGYEIYNKGISHFGFDFKGLLLEKLVLNASGVIGNSSIYKIGGGFEFNLLKNVSLVAKVYSSNYGDYPLLLNDKFTKAVEFSFGVNIGLTKDFVFNNMRKRIIYPTDYPMVINTSKPKAGKKLTVELSAKPLEGYAPLKVEFTTKIDGGESPYEVSWHYTLGSPVTTQSVNTEYTYPSPGIYNVKAVVKDKTGLIAESNTVTIKVLAVGHDPDKKYYNIDVSYDAGGLITPGTLSVEEGKDSPEFKVQAFSGFDVESLSVDSDNKGKVLTYKFTNVRANHALYAKFKSLGSQYVITVLAGTGGTMTPGTQYVDKGKDSPNFIIAPSTDYEISYVSVDGQNKGILTNYQFLKVEANHELAAFFKPKAGPVKYSIISSAQTGLAINPSGSTEYNAGANATYTVTITDSCRDIYRILVNGAVVANAPIAAPYTYNFTNIQANGTITAESRVKTYTITSSAGDGGSITPSGTYDCGSSPSYMVTANTGYLINQVIVDGAVVANNPASPYTHVFNNLTANHTMSATFSIIRYTITVTQSTGGTINPGTGQYDHGSSPSFTVTANTGYTIGQVLVDGTVVANNPASPYTLVFTNLGANHTVSATFTLNRYTITVNQATGITITPGTGEYDYGSTPTFTVTANTGYRINQVTVDGTVVSSNPSSPYTYKFAPLTANHTISATSNIIKFTITVQPKPSGTITPGTGEYNYGSTPSFVFTANTGYKIYQILVDNVVVATWPNGGNSPYTYVFPALTANHTLSVNYSLNKYDIEVSHSAGGHTSPAAGTYDVNHGSSLTITNIPDNGYDGDYILIDGARIAYQNSYTFNNVTGNHTYRVVFRVAKIFTITKWYYSEDLTMHSYEYKYTVYEGGSIDITFDSVVPCDGCQDPRPFYLKYVLLDKVNIGYKEKVQLKNVNSNHLVEGIYNN